MTTAFEAIEKVLKESPSDITFKNLRSKAKVSNGAVLAYLKRRKAA